MPVRLNWHIRTYSIWPFTHGVSNQLWVAIQALTGVLTKQILRKSKNDESWKIRIWVSLHSTSQSWGFVASTSIKLQNWWDATFTATARTEHDAYSWRAPYTAESEETLAHPVWKGAGSPLNWLAINSPPILTLSCFTGKELMVTNSLCGSRRMFNLCSICSKHQPKSACCPANIRCICMDSKISPPEYWNIFGSVLTTKFPMNLSTFVISFHTRTSTNPGKVRSKLVYSVISL